MGNIIKSQTYISNDEEERKRRKEIEDMYYKRLTDFFSCKTAPSSRSFTYKNDHFLIFHSQNKIKHLGNFKSYNLKEELHLRIKVSHIIQKDKGALSSKYQILHKLGRGATGTVYIGNNIVTNKQVAIKLTSKSQNIVIDGLEIQNEINVLKNLVHPNIVRIFEFYETPVAFYMITELCKYGELFDKIGRGFTELELSIITYQLFSALCYCHQQRIVHRDLKLENILIYDIDKIRDTSMEMYWIKLIDFGTAKLFNRNRSEKTIIGTSYYIAPEVLKKNYNEKCDTWSAGIVLYILLVGGVPFWGKTDAEMYKKIRTGKFDSKKTKFINSSLEIQDLITRLLEANIENRLSASEALLHPWFLKQKTKDIINMIDSKKSQHYASNLLNYKISSKLQQLVIAFLAHNVCDVEVTRDIFKLFGSMDKEGRGKLTKEDLLNGLLEHGIEKKEVMERIDELFMMLDSDNDGYLEYEEFIRGAIDRNILLSEKMLQFCFKFLVKENKGKLTAKSIKHALAFVNKEISNNLCKKLVYEMNPDSNEITFEEFREYMNSISSH